SVEAWIRPASLPAVGRWASVVTKAGSYSLQFHGPRLEFTIIQGTLRRRVIAPAGTIVAGYTYHVVGTYNGVTERLYVNGRRVASGARSGRISVTRRSVTIASWNGTGERFRGVIDEVAIYRHA